MPPAQKPAKPDAAAIQRLIKDFQGPDREASQRAFTALVRLGSPIRELLSSPQCDPQGDGSYSYDDMAAVINEAGPSYVKVLLGLAQAVVGEGSFIQLAAIQVCKRINPPHQLVLDVLVQGLCDRNEYVRREAARALGELRVAAPSVLKGLAAALRDSDPTVVCEAMSALGDIGAPSPEVLAGLVHFLGDANSSACGWALLALQKIGVFDPCVHDAVRQVATSTFSFAAEQPSGYGDDYEHYWQRYHDAERRHKANRQQAVELLARTPVEGIVQEALESSARPPILSEEDQRILAWFKDVDLTKYLEPLQVFWCVGQADRDAIEAEGRAIGYGKLAKRLKHRANAFNFIHITTPVGELPPESRHPESPDNAWSSCFPCPDDA